VSTSATLIEAIGQIGQPGWLVRPRAGNVARVANLRWHDLTETPISAGAVQLYDLVLEAVLHERICAALDVSRSTDVLSGLGGLLDAETTGRPAAGRLPHHVQAASEAVRQFREEFERVGAEPIKKALSACVNANADEERVALEEQLALVERDAPFEHPTARANYSWASHLVDTGLTLRRFGLDLLARRAFQGALGILERSNRRGDPFAYVIIHELAEVDAAAGNFQLAVDNFAIALEGKDRYRDPGHRDTLFTLRSLLMAEAAFDPEHAIARHQAEVARRSDSNITADDLESLLSMDLGVWVTAGRHRSDQGDDAGALEAFHRAMDAVREGSSSEANDRGV
jgi:tetratricopeptide (TPR) repeat protein